MDGHPTLVRGWTESRLQAGSPSLHPCEVADAVDGAKVEPEELSEETFADPFRFRPHSDLSRVLTPNIASSLPRKVPLLTERHGWQSRSPPRRDVF